MKKSLLIRLMPALLLAAHAPAQNPLFSTPTPPPAPKGVEATLTPDKAEIMPCEPIYASLTVKNNSTRRVELVEAVTTDSIEDTPGSIHLSAKDADGKAFPQFATNWLLGFEYFTGHPQVSDHVLKFQTVVIPVSGSHTFRVFVPRWIAFDHPGSYTLTASAVFGAPLNDSTDVTDSVLITASSPIKVIPADKEKLAAIARDLAKESASEAHDRKWQEAGAKQRWFPDEDGIPACVTLLLKNSDEIEAMQRATAALASFTDDTALAILKKLMDAPDGKLAPEAEKLREMAALGIENSANPVAITYLLTRWNDPSPAVRSVVVETLRTKVPPEKALPLLRKMENDKDEGVRNQVDEALHPMPSSPRVPSPTLYQAP